MAMVQYMTQSGTPASRRQTTDEREREEVWMAPPGQERRVARVLETLNVCCPISPPPTTIITTKEKGGWVHFH